MPQGHGTFQEIELDELDPSDEDELGMLIEAYHPEFGDALETGEELVVNGEPFSPRLHVTMHQIVGNQLMADDPPATWQTVQRLATLGYDWHNIMHMIASVNAADVYRALHDKQPFDLADYIRRLGELPGDWPK
jgi:hypothetical protein